MANRLFIKRGANEPTYRLKLRELRAKENWKRFMERLGLGTSGFSRRRVRDVLAEEVAVYRVSGESSESDSGVVARLDRLERECAEQGADYREMIEQRLREIERFKDVHVSMPTWIPPTTDDPFFASLAAEVRSQWAPHIYHSAAEQGCDYNDYWSLRDKEALNRASELERLEEIERRLDQIELARRPLVLRSKQWMKAQLRRLGLIPEGDQRPGASL